MRKALASTAEAAGCRLFGPCLQQTRGRDRALEAGVDRVAVAVSASEAHSRRNTGKRIEAALDQAREVLARAAKQGVVTRAGVMSAFGCRLEGRIPADRVSELARA